MGVEELGDRPSSCVTTNVRHSLSIETKRVLQREAGGEGGGRENQACISESLTETLSRTRVELTSSACHLSMARA